MGGSWGVVWGGPRGGTHASFIEVLDVVQGHAGLLALPCLIWALMGGRSTGERLDLQLTPPPPPTSPPSPPTLKAHVNAYFCLLSLYQLTRSVEKGQQSCLWAATMGLGGAGGWGACGRCIIIPVELCQRKLQPPVGHNAEGEMTNTQAHTMRPAGRTRAPLR